MSTCPIFLEWGSGMLSVSWNPRSRLDWFQILDSLSGRAKRLIWTFFATQCWALWTTHNKFTIEKKLRANLLTVFSKSYFPCSFGARFKDLRTRWHWLSWFLWPRPSLSRLTLLQWPRTVPTLGIPRLLPFKDFMCSSLRAAYFCKIEPFGKLATVILCCGLAPVDREVRKLFVSYALMGFINLKLGTRCLLSNWRFHETFYWLCIGEISYVGNLVGPCNLCCFHKHILRYSLHSYLIGNGLIELHGVVAEHSCKSYLNI
jgi:hypothetical protein